MIKLHTTLLVNDDLRESPSTMSDCTRDLFIEANEWWNGKINAIETSFDTLLPKEGGMSAKQAYIGLLTVFLMK